MSSNLSPDLLKTWPGPQITKGLLVGIPQFNTDARGILTVFMIHLIKMPILFTPGVHIFSKNHPPPSDVSMLERNNFVFKFW